jgi:sugar lactone lactonase YvrE
MKIKISLSIKVVVVFLAGAAEFACTSNASAAVGDLFVTELATNSIVVYAPDGTKTTFATGLNSPQGLAFDRFGNLYEADLGSGNIYKFTADGTRSTFASGLLNPVGLAFDGSGLLVAENSGNSIQRFAPDGTKTLAMTVTAPLGLAFASLNLYIANTSSVLKVASDGTSTDIDPSDASRNVALDSLNNVFVSTSFGTVSKITPGGIKTTYASALEDPNGMAFRPRRFSGDTDGVGNLLVADTAGGHIFEFTTDGTQSTFATEGSPNFLAFETILPGKLLNISTRLRAQTGDNVLIGGFIITGNVSKKVILRAIGPSLTAFGIAGALADPVLELHTPSGAVVTNDNWKSTQQAEIQATGIPPKNDLESAIVVTLAPGAYTAIVRGKNNGTGVALVEGYDLDPTGAAQLGNISTRGFVDTGENVMIGGFIIGSPTNDSARVLVRAIGPTLVNAGVANPLQDPTLELHDASGTTIAFNDNWADAHATVIQATGIAPKDARESAVLANLTPGAYTAIVRGKGNTTGVGLVEVYHLK